jgi:hypothetical protein
MGCCNERSFSCTCQSPVSSSARARGYEPSSKARLEPCPRPWSRTTVTLLPSAKLLSLVAALKQYVVSTTWLYATKLKNYWIISNLIVLHSVGEANTDLFHYWLRNCLHDHLKQPVILSLHSTIVHEPFHCTEHNRIFRGHHVNQLLTHISGMCTEGPAKSRYLYSERGNHYPLRSNTRYLQKVRTAVNEHNRRGATEIRISC